MLATKIKSKKPKESAFEIIHDGVVMAKMSSMPMKKIIMTTENKSQTTLVKEYHEKQYYVVADGVMFM